MASLACLLSDLPNLSMSSVHTSIARSAGRGILDVLVPPSFTSGTHIKVDSMDKEFSSSLWVDLPIELILLIFEAAASGDSGPTTLSLMLVSRSVHRLIAPLLYRNIRLSESRTQFFNDKLARDSKLDQHLRPSWHIRTLTIMPDSMPLQHNPSPLHFRMPNLRALVDMRSRSMYAAHSGVLEHHMTNHLQLQDSCPDDQRRYANVIDLGTSDSQPMYCAPPPLEHLVVSLVAGMSNRLRCRLDLYLTGASALKKLDFVYTQKHHWRAQMHLWDLATSPHLKFRSKTRRYINVRMILMPDEDLHRCVSSNDAPDRADEVGYARLLARLVAEPGRPQEGREHTPSAYWDYIETLTVTKETIIQLPV